MEQTYEWIVSCIESSSNGFQFKCCHTLIELFENKYKDQPGTKTMVTELYRILDDEIVMFSVDA